MKITKAKLKQIIREELSQVMEAKEMMEYVERIKSNYEGSGVGSPPSLEELEKLVRSSDFEGIKNNITTLWNDLLKWHGKNGIRIQHAVTTAFNTLNTLTRKQTG